MSSSPPTSKEIGAYAGLLGLLAAAAFGSHVAHGGFYNDDWSYRVSYRYEASDGFFGALDNFDYNAFRPVQIVYWPLTHAVFGVDSSLHLAWAVAMAVWMSASLYALLRILRLERTHAAIIAALVLLFPMSDATRLWAAAAIPLVAIAFYFTGTIVALKGLELPDRRSWLVHAAAVALYVLSLATHEIAAVAIALSLVVYLRTARRAKAATRWLVDVVAVAATLLFVTSRTFYDPLPLADQIEHARVIGRQSVKLLSWTVIPQAGRAVTVVLLVVIAVVLALALWHWRRSPHDDERASEARRWLLTAGAAGVGVGVGYAMYVPSGDFDPLSPGQLNRVNSLAAVAFVSLVYSVGMLVGILIAPSHRVRAAALAVAVGLSTLIAALYVRQIDIDKARWDRAAELQEGTVARIKRITGRPAAGTVVFSFGAPIYAAPGIPVFEVPWDLDGALKTEWDDPSVQGYPMPPGTTFVCGRHRVTAHNFNDRFATQQAAYGRALFVDVRRNRSLRIRDRQVCARAVRLYRPGPLMAGGLPRTP
jgi:hypothetical protein